MQYTIDSGKLTEGLILGNIRALENGEWEIRSKQWAVNSGQLVTEDSGRKDVDSKQWAVHHGQ